jgi:hypothetical protein
MHNLIHQPENDIHLGNNQVIEWYDFNEELDKSVDITYLTSPISSFFHSLETQSIKEDMGIGAFNFNEESIIEATKGLEKQQLIQDLLTVLNDLEFQETISVYSSNFNQTIHKETFYNLINYILNVVSKSA